MTTGSECLVPCPGARGVRGLGSTVHTRGGERKATPQQASCQASPRAKEGSPRPCPPFCLAPSSRPARRRGRLRPVSTDGALGYIPERPSGCVGPGAPESWAHSLWSPAWRRTSSRGESSSGRLCASTSGWRPPERSPGETVPVGWWGELAWWGPSEDTRSQEQLGHSTRAPGPSTWALPASAGWQGASLSSYGTASKPMANWAAPALPASLSARFPSHHHQALPLEGAVSVPVPEASSLLSDPSPSHPVSLPSIRQYELVVHPDIDPAKVYVGEMGRLKSYENQKP